MKLCMQFNIKCTEFEVVTMDWTWLEVVTKCIQNFRGEVSQKSTN